MFFFWYTVNVLVDGEYCQLSFIEGRFHVHDCERLRSSGGPDGSRWSGDP